MHYFECHYYWNFSGYIIRINEKLLKNFIIFIYIPQGLLMRSFSTIGYERDIDTLQDVANSGLPIHTSSPNLINLFGQDNSTMLTALRSKYKITPSTYNALQHAAIDRNVCGIERWSDAMNIIKVLVKYPYTKCNWNLFRLFYRPIIRHPKVERNYIL